MHKKDRQRYKQFFTKNVERRLYNFGVVGVTRTRFANEP